MEYERYIPSIRYGPDKDCVPNHTYPIGGNPALPKEFPHMVSAPCSAVPRPAQ